MTKSNKTPGPAPVEISDKALGDVAGGGDDVPIVESFSLNFEEVKFNYVKDDKKAPYPLSAPTRQT